MVVKRFREKDDKKAKAIIKDCVKHSTRPKDKEAFELLLKGEVLSHV